MSVFGVIFMMATWTRKRIDESTKYEASGKTHRRCKIIKCCRRCLPRARLSASTPSRPHLDPAYDHMFTYHFAMTMGCRYYFSVGIPISGSLFVVKLLTTTGYRCIFNNEVRKVLSISRYRQYVSTTCKFMKAHRVCVYILAPAAGLSYRLSQIIFPLISIFLQKRLDHADSAVSIMTAEPRKLRCQRIVHIARSMYIHSMMVQVMVQLVKHDPIVVLFDRLSLRANAMIFLQEVTTKAAKPEHMSV